MTEYLYKMHFPTQLRRGVYAGLWNEAAIRSKLQQWADEDIASTRIDTKVITMS